jgi:hypothetical protein
MSTNLTADDTITGGDGNDTLTFQDNGGGTDDLDHVTLVETITLGNANTEVVTLDSLVAAGATLTVNGAALVGSTLNWNGSAELDGNFSITSGNGVDVITGGAGNDTIISGHGTDTLTLTAGSNVVSAGSSNDTVYAGTGNDNIDAGADNDLIVFNGTDTLTADDTVDGGANTDKVRVDVTAAISFTLDADFTNVETLELADQGTDGFGASITLASTFNNGVNLTIDASSFDAEVLDIDLTVLEAAETLNLNASAVNNGESLSILGGAANDTVFLGVGSDTVSLGLGNDRLKIDIDDLTSADALSGGGETSADTLEFTTAGTIADTDFTNVTEFETLVLANGSNNVTLDDQAYDSGNGIVSVVGGTGADRITTYADEGQRADLTINLGSDSAIDTIVLRNNALTTNSSSLSGGGILTTQASDAASYSFGSGDFQYDPNGHLYAVTINGFVAGDGGDRLDIVFNSDTAPGVTGTSSFANNYDLGDPDPVVAGLNSGGVIEISSANYQLNIGWDLEDVASILSGAGFGNALVQLKDGDFTVIVYDGTTSTANAHIFNIRVDDGDGFDLAYVQSRTEGLGASGADVYNDLDAIEYVGMLSNIGADALTAQNFI